MAETLASDRRPLVTDSAGTSVIVYYATMDGSQLLPLTLEIKATTELARVALEKLLAGPPNDYAIDSIPADVKLLDIYSIYNTVYINLTGEFLSIPAESARLAVEALCATVLPLANGYKLQILVEGQGREYLHDVYIGDTLSLPLINPVRQDLRSQLTDDDTEFAEAVYYRLEKNSPYLVPQTLPVQLSPDQPAALTMVSALLPLLLPANSQINSIEIIEGVAYIDFSSGKALALTDAQEQMRQEALMRSLTAIPGVNAVQLLDQGQAVDNPPGENSKTTPLEYDDQPLNPA
jgi:germination protein M